MPTINISIKTIHNYKTTPMDKKTTNINEILLMSYLLKETDFEQTKEVEKWLNASEKNINEFNKLKQTWSAAGRLSPMPVAVDTNVAWNKINSKINFYDDKSTKKINLGKNLFRTILKIAAVFVFLIGGISAYMMLKKPDIQKIALKSFDIKIVDTLTDGSIVSLNKNSQLTYNKKFNKNARETELIGEAFFDIKINSKKPFFIKVKDGNIKVTGTSFNVNTNKKNQNTEVFVKNGTVYLFNVNQQNDTFSIMLSSGEKGTFNSETGKPEMLKPKIVNDMYWINNIIIFDNVKLYKATETLENIFQISIIFEDKEIKNLTYSATFSNDSIEQIIEIITNTFNLKVSKNDNIYTLKKSE